MYFEFGHIRYVYFLKYKIPRQCSDLSVLTRYCKRRLYLNHVTSLALLFIYTLRKIIDDDDDDDV